MAFCTDGGGGTAVAFCADGGGGTAVAFCADVGGGGTSVAFDVDGEVTFVVFDADDETRYHSLGGPSVDDVPSKRAYDANHADASPNMFNMLVTELVSHPEMSALNDDAV